jgi:hypothetical protein
VISIVEDVVPIVFAVIFLLLILANYGDSAKRRKWEDSHPGMSWEQWKEFQKGNRK